MDSSTVCRLLSVRTCLLLVGKAVRKFRHRIRAIGWSAATTELRKCTRVKGYQYRWMFMFVIVFTALSGSLFLRVHITRFANSWQHYSVPYLQTNSSRSARWTGFRPYCSAKCIGQEKFSFWVRSGSEHSGGPLICFDGYNIVDPNNNETFSRGINVVVINAKLKAVMDYRTFDTHASFEACLDMVQYLTTNVPAGSPVLMASYDDMNSSLCIEVQEMLKTFGSNSIRWINYRDSWVFVGEYGLNASLSVEAHASKQSNEEYAKVAEIDGCIAIPMSGNAAAVRKDFGLTLTKCGMSNCTYNEISTFISTGDSLSIQPTICVAGTYAVKPGAHSDRGFNFVVVDPVTKQVLAVRQYNPLIEGEKSEAGSGQESSGVDIFLETVGYDVILIGLIGAEGSKCLKNSTRILLSEFGASLAWEMRASSIMYFVGQRGLQDSPIQEISHSPDTEKSAPNLEKRFCLATNLTAVAAETRSEKKGNFCRTYGGYGSFCNSPNIMKPFTVLSSPSPTAVDDISKVPIVVMAGFNHLALTASLNALLDLPGLRSEKVTVAYYELFSSEFDELVGLFNFNSFVRSDVLSARDLLDAALANAWAQNPEAAEAIVIEDQAVVAPGFLDYMRQVLPAMKEYPSIGVASAWNPNSFSHSASDLSATYYVDQFVGVAFLLNKSFYEKHMKGRMSLCCARRSWFEWFSGAQFSSDYQFLMPEVARADMYRSSDSYMMSVIPALAALTRGKRLVSEETTGRINISTVSDYLKIVKASTDLQKASSEMLSHLCVKNAKADGKHSTTPVANTPLVIVFSQQHEYDYAALYEMCDCFQLACLNTSNGPVGTYRGLLRFSLYGQPAFLLGSKWRDLHPVI